MSPGELTEIRALLFRIVDAQGETRAELRNLREDIESRAERIDKIGERIGSLERNHAYTAGRNAVLSFIVSSLTALGVGVGARNI